MECQYRADSRQEGPGKLDLKTSGPESRKSDRDLATGRKLWVGQLNSRAGLGVSGTSRKYLGLEEAESKNNS